MSKPTSDALGQAERRGELRARRQALALLASYDFGDEGQRPGDPIFTANRRIRAAMTCLVETWREQDRKRRARR